MTNKHYRVGYTLERDVKIALEQDGYTVFRSAGSHSQADLIALGTGEVVCEANDVRTQVPLVLLIQCKRHKNLMTRREIITFYDFANALSCVPMIAYRDKGIHMEQIYP